MDRIYDCLDSRMLYEIYMPLSSAVDFISLEFGDSIVESSQYQDLIHVLHDVQSCLAQLHFNDCKNLESKYENNKFKKITGLS